MIQIDENLPWIEIDKAYMTKREAMQAASRALRRMKTRIVNMPDKKPVKAIATIRIRG